MGKGECCAPSCPAALGLSGKAMSRPPPWITLPSSCQLEQRHHSLDQPKTTIVLQRSAAMARHTLALQVASREHFRETSATARLQPSRSLPSATSSKLFDPAPHLAESNAQQKATFPHLCDEAKDAADEGGVFRRISQRRSSTQTSRV